MSLGTCSGTLQQIFQYSNLGHPLASATGGRATAGVLPIGLDVPPESCACLAQAICSFVDANLLLIAADLPAHVYTGPLSPVQSPVFGVLSTGAAASCKRKSNLPPLPVGNLVTGMPAALLSCAHVRIQLWMMLSATHVCTTLMLVLSSCVCMVAAGMHHAPAHVCTSLGPRPLLSLRMRLPYEHTH
jgi:hypothetical protein